MSTKDELESGPLSQGLGASILIQADEGWPAGPSMSQEEAQEFIDRVAAMAGNTRLWIERLVIECQETGDGHEH